MYQLIQKLQYPTLVLVILFQNCKIDKKGSDLLEGYLYVEDKQDAATTQPFLILDFNSSENYSEDPKSHISNSDSFDINPFKEYLERSFFNGVSSRYNINEIPGHIFKDNHDGTYQKISVKRFVKNYSYPEVKLVDKVYFTDRVTDTKQLNASAKIIGVNIDKENIIELTLKDETTAYLQDSLINDTLITAFINRINPSELQDYYFVQGVTISSVTHRSYKKQSYKAKVDYAWVTASGSSYGSKENIKSKLDISLELTKLKGSTLDTTVRPQ
ncbi:MAG: hypothetical protein SGI89_10010 [bacterium]|nr:hypothetical protein [bacterium]